MFMLSDDLISHIMGFLGPRDFYNVKTVASSGLSPAARDQLNCVYWWREEVALSRAVAAQCPSLARWIIHCDRDMDPSEALAVLSGTAICTAIYTAFERRWPDQLDHMLNRWVETANVYMFTYQLARHPEITADTLDLIYTSERWLMLARVFQYAPRTFVAWAFGTYCEAADAELILNIKFVLYHLDHRAKAVLIRILGKYHEWLWGNKLDRAATLQTIASLHSLEIITFDPSRYFELASASPVHDFLEYLLLRGLEVEPYMIQRTHDLKKMRLLMAAQFVQKYQKIMVMLAVLIAAIVVNILRGFGEPVEALSPVLKEPERKLKIYFDKTKHGCPS